MSTTSAPRRLYPEVVWFRGVAALAVVALHALSRADRLTDEIRLAPYILPLMFATPVFVFISEYLFSRAYPDGLPAGFTRKRLTHLVAPFLAMGIAYSVYDNWGAGAATIAAGALGNIFLGQFVGYFVLVIVQFYILHHYLHPHLKRWNPWIVLTVTFVINAAYVGYFNLVREGPGTIEQYIWHRGYWLPAIGWIFYFALGYYAGQHRERLLAGVKRYRWVVLAAVIAGVALLEYNLAERTFRFLLSSKRPDILLYAPAVIALLALLSLSRPTPPRFLILISNYSYSIYLLHWFVVDNIPQIHPDPFLTALWFAVSGLVFAIGVSWLANLTPWGAYLVGKPALPVLECVDSFVELAGVDEAAQDVVVEVAESQGDTT